MTLYIFAGADDHVTRGCLGKKDFKDLDDTYKWKEEDDCKKSGGVGMLLFFIT